VTALYTPEGTNLAAIGVAAEVFWSADTCEHHKAYEALMALVEAGEGPWTAIVRAQAIALNQTCPRTATCWSCNNSDVLEDNRL